MIKAVIFDLDGTLLNTIEDLANACNYALESEGFKIHDKECYRAFVGNGRYKLIERILPEENRDNDTIEKLVNIFDEYYGKHMVDMTKPYDGINELIQTLKDNKVKMSIVSNKPHEFTTEVVKKFFEDSLEVVYGQRCCRPTKPDPQTLFEVIEELDISLDQCIYVGDSDVDMKTAQNAGVTSVGVEWGFRGKGELEEAGADYLVKTPGEIVDLVNRL